MTHPRFLEQLIGYDTGALEHVPPWSRGEAHLLFPWASVLFRAIVAGKFAFRATCVR